MENHLTADSEQRLNGPSMDIKKDLKRVGLLNNLLIFYGRIL